MPEFALEANSSWHFVKWISLNNVFVTPHIRNVLRFFSALQPLLYIYSLKRGTKWRRFWVQRIQFKNDFYWNSKVLLCSWLEVYFFIFWMVISTTLFQPGSTFVNRRWKWQCCVDVDSTLFNVVNSNVDVRNVASTLIWRCTASRRHINIRTTLKCFLGMRCYEKVVLRNHAKPVNFVNYCRSTFLKNTAAFIVTRNKYSLKL